MSERPPVFVVRRIVVPVDASPHSLEALDAAAALALAEAAGGALEVLVTAPSEGGIPPLRNSAEAQVSGRPVPARMRSLVASPEDALREAVREAKPGLLVVSADSTLLGPDDAGGVLEESGQAVLLVR